MSTHRYFDAICVVVLVLTLLITVLFMNGEAYGIQVIVDEDAEAYGHAVLFTENDKNGAWDTARATRITLDGDEVSVFGGGAYAFDGSVMITGKGKYVISGTLTDGSMIVDTDSSAKVWIMLDGADITCSTGACLDVEQADKVFLTLAEGSDNRLTTTGFSEENRTAGMDGAVFSRDDLTINGSGGLTVTAAEESGIVCNDELVLTGGTIAVDAAADALHVNDNLRIMETQLNLKAGDDGISLTGLESELYWESGTLTVTATGDDINAENNIRILNGSLTLEAGDDGISVGGITGTLEITGGTLQITAADKGIAAENNVTLAGGTVEIDAEDDGISTAGLFRMEDGKLAITTRDDGIHSDTAVEIRGGTVQIPSCYEGIEAVTIDVSGGEITIYPEDDGLNANGGTDSFGGAGFGGRGGFIGGPGGMFGGPGSGMPGQTGEGEDGGFELPMMPDENENERPEPLMMPDENGAVGSEAPVMGSGEEPHEPGTDAAAGERPAMTMQDAASSEMTENTETWIHVSGGSLTVINSVARDADGLDSNGDIIISGGVIRVSLTNSGSNSALDYGSESGGVMEISGGEVIACGSYAMAEGFDDSSSQCSILYNIKRGAPAGTTVALEDSEGNVILSYEVPCSFSSVAISCPEMQMGETYLVAIGDSVEEITLDSVSASFGDAQSEGFGGPMNWGHMRFRPESEQNDALPSESETTDAAE